MIKQGMVAPCDIVILKGECLVDEAVLTGESIPISKNELPRSNKSFKPSENQAYIIFCGSRVL